MEWCDRDSQYWSSLGLLGLTHRHADHRRHKLSSDKKGVNTEKNIDKIENTSL